MSDVVEPVVPVVVEPVVPVLEPAAAAFAEATSRPPFLFELAPEEGRKAVDEVQSGPVELPEVDEEWLTVSSGPTGSVRARIVRPAGVTGPLPVILYTHGAGWVFGNAHTHDRLVRELSVGSRRGGRVPRVRPVAGSPVPGGHRAELRGGPMGRRAGRGARSGRDAPRGGRMIRWAAT